MVRRSSQIPQHCQHKPKRVGYVRLNGRVIYTGPWNSAEADQRYNQLVSEWLASGRRLPGLAVAGPDYTIADLVADFWVHAEGYYRKDGQPTRELANIRSAMKPLLEVYGLTPAANFGPLALKALRERMVLSGLCRPVVNQRVGMVKRMFRWATSEERVPADTFHALQAVEGLRQGRSPAREPEPVRPVEAASFEAVLSSVASPVAAMLRLQWLTGMRPGEVTTMRLIDIDRSGETWIYKPAAHKTQHHGKVRQVALGPQARAVLAPFLSTQPSAYIFSPRQALSEQRTALRSARQTPMTPSQRAREERARLHPRQRAGDRYTSVTLGQAVRRACVRVGIAPWSPNRLRHSAATRLRKQFGLDLTRAVMGHSSTAVTEIYAEVDNARVVEVMASVG